MRETVFDCIDVTLLRSYAGADAIYGNLIKFPILSIEINPILSTNRRLASDRAQKKLGYGEKKKSYGSGITAFGAVRDVFFGQSRFASSF